MIASAALDSLFNTGNKLTQASFRSLRRYIDERTPDGYISTKSYKLTGSETDAERMQSAFTDAIASGKPIYVGELLNLSTLGELATTANGQEISIIGEPGMTTFDFGSKSSKFIRIEHNDCKIRLYNITYTGGTFATQNTDLGFHFVWADTSTCNNVKLFEARNIYGENSYSFANFEWGGESGILEDYILHNIHLTNLAWKAFTMTGLQGCGMMNLVKINGCKIHGIRVGDETIDYAKAIYTDPSEPGYVDTEGHGLIIGSLKVQNVTGPTGANGIQIQGTKYVQFDTISVNGCYSADNSDSEGVYIKSLKLNGNNLIAVDCRDEANVILKGGSPSGSATPSKGIQINNIITVQSEKFKNTYPSHFSTGLKIRSDDVIIKNFQSYGADLPLDIFGNPGDYESDIIIEGILIDGYVDRSIYVHGTKANSIMLKGVVRNSRGLQNLTTNYVIEETNVEANHIDYDLTLYNVEGGLGTNHKFAKLNQRDGQCSRIIRIKGDHAGQIDYNDFGPTQIHFENFAKSASNPPFSIRGSASTPWLDYLFPSNQYPLHDLRGVATISAGQSSVVVSHGASQLPDPDNCFASALDGSVIKISNVTSSQMTLTRYQADRTTLDTNGDMLVKWLVYLIQDASDALAVSNPSGTTINLSTYQTQLSSIVGVDNPATASGTLILDSSFDVELYQTELENLS